MDAQQGKAQGQAQMQAQAQTQAQTPTHAQKKHTQQQQLDEDSVTTATLRWLRSTVIGLNLCPWAGGALAGGNLRVVTYPAEGGGRVDGEVCRDGGGGVGGVGDVCLGVGAGDVGVGVGVGVVDGGGCGSGDCIGAEREPIPGCNEEALQGLVVAAAMQAEALGSLEGQAARNATTLVVARPPLAADFEEFLAVAEAVNDFIDDSGLRGTVQVRCSSVTQLYAV